MFQAHDENGPKPACHSIDVRMIVDKSNPTARIRSATFLANQGVAVRVVCRYAIMYDKFIVVDGAVVETSSSNFTASGESRNTENVLVFAGCGGRTAIRAGMGAAVGRVGGVEVEVLAWLSK
jgi:phosphatidylserine/phosphatidylglycerophosphate/cardiolipin synthase-like enzyme